MKQSSKRILFMLFTTALCLMLLPSVKVSAASRPRLSKTKLTLKQGKKKKLKVKKSAGKKIKWKSKKKRIATVSKKGLVRAKRVGKTTITAKVGKKTLRCRVTVVPRKTGKTGTTGKTPPTPPTTKPDALYNADTVSTSDYAKYYSTSAVHKGQATYFDGGYIGGCCNLDAIASGFDVVAMNEYDYNNGLLAGAFIEITGPKGTVKALVTDLLPADESVRGNLDLNEKTFAKIANPIDGRVNVTWRVIALNAFHTISYRFKAESTQWWAQVQVVGHTYPIAKLEYKAGGRFVELQREQYNFFTAQNGLGTGAITFRVTDIFGHQLTDTGIVMSPGKTVPGKSNFPE